MKSLQEKSHSLPKPCHCPARGQYSGCFALTNSLWPQVNHLNRGGGTEESGCELRQRTGKSRFQEAVGDCPVSFCLFSEHVTGAGRQPLWTYTPAKLAGIQPQAEIKFLSCGRQGLWSAWFFFSAVCFWFERGQRKEGRALSGRVCPVITCVTGVIVSAMGCCYFNGQRGHTGDLVRGKGVFEAQLTEELT